MTGRRRVRRLNQLLREELSRLIRREVKDPRVGLVTVTDVDVTSDLEHATVYVRTVESDRSMEELLAGLHSAGGYLRHALGKELHLRRIPELRFEEDRSLERARRIEALLDQALEGDEDPGSDGADDRAEP
ncbi:MAG: 30S ribosome-binding factor RbfA [Candidatus Palauibacterales bacterium]|nr:30S ribosome-binding factor RbfA [Candidatus Palauibacterales bacterium]MDP2530506.1 30S ribosome-binding factor RbfA [Candidatus Palauibacterales bacterium]MDP2582935.1 30S ribosome-binding factor RbfA [Candidatus Palauibacterales bacterium]